MFGVVTVMVSMAGEVDDDEATGRALVVVGLGGGWPSPLYSCTKHR